MSTVSRTTRYRNLTGKGNGTATFTYDSDRPLQVTVAFDGTPWIECPECRHLVWCSEEDPDAGLSEMWRHIYWTHALADGRRATAAKALTAELLAKVTVVPGA